MPNEELITLANTLIHGETIRERMKAQWEIAHYGDVPMVLRLLLQTFRTYIRELMTGRRKPREENPTPFLQFYEGFAHIQYLLWIWRDNEPIPEILLDMLNEPDRGMRALAVIGLGAGNVMWEDARIEPHLRSLQGDADPLIRAAAHLALEYLRFGQQVRTMTPLDALQQQRLEQHAAQVMGGLAIEQGGKDGDV